MREGGYGESVRLEGGGSQERESKSGDEGRDGVGLAVVAFGFGKGRGGRGMSLKEADIGWPPMQYAMQGVGKKIDRKQSFKGRCTRVLAWIWRDH